MGAIMSRFALLLLLPALATTAPVSISSLPLAVFDGSKQDFKWIEENDPVMGGVSTNCTFTHDKASKTGVFVGEVQDVPSLKAPGFCFARTMTVFSSSFKDASNYSSYQIEYQAGVPYKGFKAAFVSDTIDSQFGAFKADFAVEAGDDFQSIQIPLPSSLTNG